MKLRRPDPTDDLVAIDWFAGLSPAALRTAAKHADWCEVAAGTRLQRRDLHARWLWIVAAGALETFATDDVVRLVLPGAAWGEVDVVLGEPSSVDVVAAVPSTVVSLPAAAYHGLLAEPSFAMAAAQRLARTIYASLTSTVSASPVA